MKSNCKKNVIAVAVLTMMGISAAYAGYDADNSTAMGSRSSNEMTFTTVVSGTAEQVRAMNADMLIRTLSEEQTEVQQLAAQREAFLRMGTAEDIAIARLWAKWIREHKAASPKLMNLIRANGGDPAAATLLKQPVLGTREEMLMATHHDHEQAVMTSQMRFGMTNSWAIKNAMNKRATLARKHIRQMEPYHDKMMMGNHSM